MQLRPTKSKSMWADFGEPLKVMVGGHAYMFKSSVFQSCLEDVGLKKGHCVDSIADSEKVPIK